MISLNDNIFKITLKAGREIYVYGDTFRNSLNAFNIKAKDVLWYMQLTDMSKVNEARLYINGREHGKKFSNFLKHALGKPVFIDTNISMADYWEAYYDKDTLRMRKALLEYAKKCPHLSGECLNNKYCPDCNFYEREN